MNGKESGLATGPSTSINTDDPPPPLCDTLTVTNGDNVYSPDFLKRTLGPLQSPRARTWWARTGSRITTLGNSGAWGSQRLVWATPQRCKSRNEG